MASADNAQDYHQPSFHEMSADLVTIEAGKGEGTRKFNVQKDLICAASPYFKAAFNGGWKETSAQSIPLKDVTPKVFAAFLDWLYFRRVPSIKFFCRQPCFNCGGSCNRPVQAKQALDFGTIPTDDEARVDAILQQDSSGTALYIFADQYNVPHLRERIIDETWWSTAHGGDEPHISALVLAMENLPANSPLCRLLIDALARTFDATTIICEFEKFMCQRIVANVWLRVFLPVVTVLRADGIPKMRPLCSYHEHTDELESYQCDEKRGKRKIEARDMAITMDDIATGESL